MRVKETTVSTEDGDVSVHKLALADYADILREIRSLPRFMQEFEKLPRKKNPITGKDEANTSDLIGIIPNLSADLLPEVCEIVSKATDKDGAFIAQLDLADFVDVLSAIFELNRFDKVVASIKKMSALNQSRKAEQSPKQPDSEPEAPSPTNE